MSNNNVLGSALAEVAGPMKDFCEKLAGEEGPRWFAEFKRFLRKEATWVREVFSVVLGGKTTTDQIAKTLKDAKLWVNDYITQANFPLKPHDEETAEIEIIDPGCSFSEEEGLEYLKAAGLTRPTYEHALRFAEQCGKTTTSEKKPFIIFLHEAWRDPLGGRRVVCIHRVPQRRRLLLRYPGDGFRGSCVLAGVRPRK